MPTWLPFTQAWNQARVARAEHTWSKAIARHHLGDSTAARALRWALWQGAAPSFEKAQAVLNPPLPGILNKMLAAAHGNWSLMRAFVLYSPPPGSKDVRGKTWVHHWADGVLDRHAAGNALRLTQEDPALSALVALADQDEQVLCLLGESDASGRPAARLLAAGVDWNLLE